MISPSSGAVLQAGKMRCRGVTTSKLFGLDIPLWQQYLNFWKALFHGDLGRSAPGCIRRPVIAIIKASDPLRPLHPASGDSARAGSPGTQVGALAARRRWLDNTLLPLGYILTATPYMWLALVLAWALGNRRWAFSLSPGAYSFAIRPHLSWLFVLGPAPCTGSCRFSRSSW